ncbi:CapA family protein [Luteimicrobium subarcticum]|uniref:Poly-gamma-glutamate synthesis protein (Capsule biosynthesis protein) n=1 Tax=Luteimicrobium subarcticum TaxID=620910 RepID=A0A2M8WTX4_9MICO|nr:CapA family protein [Luteimicrobium subarcticum]PJI94387.1 poly-gamma-glutamate synthesis protein (capsule biosynthesis protein) [Luteimicrobium subarcticum]
MPRHARLPQSRAGQRFLAGSVVAALVVVMIVLSINASSGKHPDPTPIGIGTRSATPTATPTPTPTPTPAEPAVFTIVAAGDVLPHSSVIEDAKTASGGYDFSTELSGLDDWVGGADLALCHMEVPYVPQGEKISTYPVFGVPSHVATDLAEQGWDGCSNASNHAVDRGFAGISTTLDAFDAVGLGHAGTGRTAAEAASPQLYRLEREGQTITVAHISATYGLNGLPLPAQEPWSVELIDTKKIVAQAKAARKNGADLVVVSIHDGVEYTATPTTDQKSVMKALARSGEVDLVIGAHAHVPQPVAHLKGGVDGRGMWVAYGVGNMLSNQDAACCVAQTASGLLITATITKPADGPAEVTGFEWTPLTVDRTGGHRVYAIPDVIDDPKGVGHLSHAELEARLGRVEDVVGTAAPERTAPPTSTGPAPDVVPHEHGNPKLTATATATPTPTAG